MSYVHALNRHTVVQEISKAAKDINLSKCQNHLDFDFRLFFGESEIGQI